MIKAHISHATASRPDYKVHAVHFSENDDMLSKDDKCPHKQVGLKKKMLAIFLCGFATTSILTGLPTCWGIKKQKALNYQESSNVKR